MEVSPSNLGGVGTGIESPASRDSPTKLEGTDIGIDSPSCEELLSVLGGVDTSKDSEFTTVESVDSGRASPPRLEGVFTVVISEIATEDEVSVCATVGGILPELRGVDTGEDSDFSTVNAVDSGEEFEGV